jgi:hypothetical protein
MASLSAAGQRQQGSGQFNLIKLLMRSGTFKFAFARSLGGGYNSNNTYTLNNPTLSTGQIAVYIVTFFTSFGTIGGSWGNADYRPEGIVQINALDIQFFMNNSVRTTPSSQDNRDNAFAPIVSQGIFSSSSAYSGSAFNVQVYSYQNNSGLGPDLHATISCFVYTPFT